MIALVLAAAVATSPLKTDPSCASAPVQTTAPSGQVHVQKLAELPDAPAIRAVLRDVDGCPYQDVIRFHASTGGPAWPSGTLVPAAGKIEPATPTSDGR